MFWGNALPQRKTWAIVAGQSLELYAVVKYNAHMLKKLDFVHPAKYLKSIIAQAVS